MQTSQRTVLAMAGILVLLLLSSQGLANTTIDFEQFSGPSVFTGVQPPLTVDGVTFSGGQLLKATSALPADPTVVYGTAFFCTGCSPTITMDFATPASQLSFFLANGETFTVTYLARDDLGNLVTLQLVANFLSGAGTIQLPGPNIHQVTITSNTSQWDFFIDNITFSTFAGTPGKANCHGKSVSALANEFGGLDTAASVLGYPSVRALQNAIRAFCGN